MLEVSFSQALRLNYFFLLVSAILRLDIANTLFQQHKRRLYTWTTPDGQHQMVRLIIFFEAKEAEALYSQRKQDWELTVA